MQSLMKMFANAVDQLLPALPSWTARATGAPAAVDWLAAATNSKATVLTGTGPRAARTLDGLTYTNYTLTAFGTGIPSPRQRDLIVVNDTFVAKFITTGAGGASAVYTSSDGITWTQRLLDTTGQLNNKGIAAVGSTVIVPVNSGASVRIQKSSDGGITWSASATIATSTAQCIEASGGNFILGGNTTGPTPTIRTSTDGVTWTLRTIPGSLTGQVFRLMSANGVVLAIGGGAYQTAVSVDNGITWTTVTGLATHTVNDLFFANGLYICVGRQSTGSAFIATSANGVNWTSRLTVPATTTLFNSIGSDGVTLYAAGYNTAGPFLVYKSSDAITWTADAGPASQNLVSRITVTLAGRRRLLAGAGNAVSTNP